jgi:hypothetical protein
MNWQNIKVSADNTHFLFEGKQIFEKHFIEVLKFHSPGIAPVFDNTGAYHINIKGEAIYSERYARTFGYYCNRAAVVLNEEWFHINELGKHLRTLELGVEIFRCSSKKLLIAVRNRTENL